MAPWIGLTQATDYSHIGRKRLIRLAKDNRVVGFKDPDSGRGDWIFDQASLDAYRLSQYKDKDVIKEKAMSILASLPT